MVMESSSQIDRARPITSKPGPRGVRIRDHAVVFWWSLPIFADEHGTSAVELASRLCQALLRLTSTY